MPIPSLTPKRLSPAQKEVRADKKKLAATLDAMKAAKTKQAKAMKGVDAEGVILRTLLYTGVPLKATPKLAAIAGELREARLSGRYGDDGMSDGFDDALAKAAQKNGVAAAEIPQMVRARLKRLV